MFYMSILLIPFLLMMNLGTPEDKIENLQPEEKYSVGSDIYNGKPIVIVVNTGLRDFKGKSDYEWYCSFILDYNKFGKNGMPTLDESDFVYSYFRKLDAAICGDKSNPNALFVARITYNGHLEIIWQVKNPEIVHKYLGDIIVSKTYPREMDYVIEKDEAWEHADYYLNCIKDKK